MRIISMPAIATEVSTSTSAVTTMPMSTSVGWWSWRGAHNDEEQNMLETMEWIIVTVAAVRTCDSSSSSNGMVWTMTIRY